MRVQLNQFTLPPEAILIRRMHGIVAVVLGQLRAGADWGAIAAEYLHGEPPSTPLGEAEAAFFTRRGRATSAALGGRRLGIARAPAFISTESIPATAAAASLRADTAHGADDARGSRSHQRLGHAIGHERSD